MNKEIKVVLSLAVLAGIMYAVPASAGEKSPAIFPTDVLGKFSGAITTTYTYATIEYDTVMVGASGTNVLNYDASANVVQIKAQLGLGYGLQLGASQDIEIGAKTKYSWDDGSSLATDYTGGYNPAFELSWNPMNRCYSKDPLQLLISYKVKPKGLASEKMGEDYTKNSGAVFLSYKLAGLKIRPYLGYNYSKFGKGNTAPGDHTNTIMAGVERSSTKNLKLNLDYSAVLYGSNPDVNSFTVHNLGASVVYKLAFIKAFGLYIEPFVNVGVSDGITYKTEGTVYNYMKSGTAIEYSTGLAVKSVF